jgi:hypothetical protein
MGSILLSMLWALCDTKDTDGDSQMNSNHVHLDQHLSTPRSHTGMAFMVRQNRLPRATAARPRPRSVLRREEQRQRFSWTLLVLR